MVTFLSALLGAVVGGLFAVAAVYVAERLKSRTQRTATRRVLRAQAQFVVRVATDADAMADYHLEARYLREELAGITLDWQLLEGSVHDQGTYDRLIALRLTLSATRQHAEAIIRSVASGVARSSAFMPRNSSTHSKAALS